MGTSQINSITTDENTAPPGFAESLAKLRDQLVLYDIQIYASATHRTTVYNTLGISPPKGAVCYRIDGNIYEYYNGTAWTAFAGALQDFTAAWPTWVPTLSNLTQGSGAVIAQWRQTGKTADFIFSFTYGAGSAVGTLPSFTLPFTPKSTYTTFATMGTGELLDSGTAAYFAIGRLTAGGAVEVVYPGTSGIHTPVAVAAPFTWANNDRILIHGTAIEIA